MSNEKVKEKSGDKKKKGTSTLSVTKTSRPIGRTIHSGEVITTRDSDRPGSQFTYAVGDNERDLHHYLRSIFDPGHYNARVPNRMGGFELSTKLWTTQEDGVVTAGADGNAVLGVCANGWLEAGNYDGEPDTSCLCLGHSRMGTASFRSSNAAVNYPAMPAISVALDPFGASGVSGQTLDVPTDSPLTATTRIRLVSMSLSVHTILSNNLAKGEVLLCCSVNPGGEARGGLINGASWDDILKTNDEVMTRATRGLANWGPNDVFEVVAIPGEKQAFEMLLTPSSAYSAGPLGTDGVVPRATLGMFARGLAPGDKISYHITYNWESELAKTNSSAGDLMKPGSVPIEHLQLAASNSQKYAVAPKPGIHALPWIETMATVNPGAVQALALHPGIPKQLKPVVPFPGVNKMPLIHVSPQKPGFLQNVADFAKTALHGVANSGVLNNVPYVGGILNGLAGTLSKLFD